jgi:N-acetylneuraminic acid mutarotase
MFKQDLIYLFGGIDRNNPEITLFNIVDKYSIPSNEWETIKIKDKYSFNLIGLSAFQSNNKEVLLFGGKKVANGSS